MYNPQMTAERIESLAKSKGVSISEMLSALGMNKNALFTMKNSGYLPRIENLCKIADFFCVSVDYLIGRTDTPGTHPEISVANNNQSNISGSNNISVNAAVPDKKDTLTEQFLQRFDSLSFEDKLAIMQHVQDIKKSPSEGGNK